MKTYILFLMASCVTWSVNGQTNQLPDTSKHHGHDLSSSINISPEYPGGIRAFYKLLERNLKYPPVAQLLGLNGRVVVSFIIEKDGTVNDARPVN
jgi:outer membrane biosynthesis protein TonB